MKYILLFVSCLIFGAAFAVDVSKQEKIEASSDIVIDEKFLPTENSPAFSIQNFTDISGYINFLSNGKLPAFKFEKKSLVWALGIKPDRYYFNRKENALILKKYYPDDKLANLMSDWHTVIAAAKKIWIPESSLGTDNIESAQFHKYVAADDKSKVEKGLWALNHMWNFDSSFWAAAAGTGDRHELFIKIKLEKYDVLWFNWNDHWRGVAQKLLSADVTFENKVAVASCYLWGKNRKIAFAFDNERLAAIKVFARYSSFDDTIDDFMFLERRVVDSGSNRHNLCHNKSEFNLAKVKVETLAAEIRTGNVSLAFSCQIKNSNCLLRLLPIKDYFIVELTFSPKDK